MIDDSFDPDNPTIFLMGCCDYDEIWKPGIEGWGASDEESRSGGYISIGDYDELLRRYKALMTPLPTSKPDGG